MIVKQPYKDVLRKQRIPITEISENKTVIVKGIVDAAFLTIHS